MTVSIAMVTLFGTLALVLLPLLHGPLGLTDLQFGMWAGASVHEVGQVVAAASPAGATVVAVAVVVKLTRVVMLAPVVATVSVLQRMKSPAASDEIGTHPAGARSSCSASSRAWRCGASGALPDASLGWITHVQVAALGAALFGMGCSVRIASLFKKSGAVMVVSTVGTLFIGAISLAGILLVTGPFS